MSQYLEATGRPELATAARAAAHELCADDGAVYDDIVDIDLSCLEPRINGPFTPDFSTPISKFREAVEENKWPAKLTAGLIGSCTNSSFEDLSLSASLARQAMDAGLKPKMPILLSPGSEKTRATLEEARVMDVFRELGSTILSNACGPCCGSWDRQDMKKVRVLNRHNVVQETNNKCRSAHQIRSSARTIATSLAALTPTQIQISFCLRLRW